MEPWNHAKVPQFQPGSMATGTLKSHSYECDRAKVPVDPLTSYTSVNGVLMDCRTIHRRKKVGGGYHRIPRARKTGPTGPAAPQQEWSVRPISGRTLLSPRPAKYQRSKVSE